MPGIGSVITDVRTSTVSDTREEAIAKPGENAGLLARQLRGALDREDVATIVALVNHLLDPARVDLAAFRLVIDEFGGVEAFLSRVKTTLGETAPLRLAQVGLASGEGAFETRVRNRWTGNTTAGEEETTLEAVKQAAARGLKLAAVTTIPGIGIYFVKEELDAVVEEFLSVVKGMLRQASEALAGTDNFYLQVYAYELDLLNEYLVPGTTLELALTLLPVGKIAVLLKPLLLKAAALTIGRVVTAGMAAAAIASLRRFLTGAIKQAVDTLLSPLGHRMADALGAGGGQIDDKVMKSIMAFLTKVEEHVIPPSLMGKRPSLRKVGKSAVVLNATEMATRAKHLKAIFSLPKGSLATTEFIVGKDGAVIQKVRSTLFKNKAGRGTESLGDLAESQGIVRLGGIHYSHVIASSRGGDDAFYNLLQCEGRINVSYFRQFDMLEPGTKVEAEIVFETFEDALQRIPKEIHYYNAATGAPIGALQNLLVRPSATWRAGVRRKTLEYASLLAEVQHDPKYAEAFRRLIELLRE